MLRNLKFARDFKKTTAVSIYDSFYDFMINLNSLYCIVYG